jgi:muramidase (phage lysozyme)
MVIDDMNVVGVLDHFSNDLISELRRLVMEDDNDPRQERLTEVKDRDARAAMSIMEELPLGSGRAGILSLVNNPEDEKNKEYINKNKAILRAFPILKQIYGFEKNIEMLEGKEYWDAYDKLRNERKSAINDFEKIFGKGNLPEQFTDNYELNRIEARIKQLDKQTAEEQHLKDNAPRLADEETFRFIEEQTSPPIPYRNESPAFEDSSGFVSSMSNDDFAELSRYEENARPAHEEDQEVPYDAQDVTLNSDERQLLAMAPAHPVSSLDYDEKQLLAMPPSSNYSQNISPSTGDLDDRRSAPPSEGNVEPDERSAEPAFGRALGLNRSEDRIKRDVAISKALERGDYDEVIRIQQGGDPELFESDDYSYMDEQRHRYQDGGFVPPEEAPVPVDGPPLPEDDMGFVGSPEEAAVDQVDAAQNGDMGGDNVEADVPEGSFVLNSYAVELAGIKDIEKLVKDAKKFYMEQKQQEGLVSPEAGQEEDIEIRVSEGEYIIPPALVRIIGRDRLEKINKRGIDEFERQQAEETEAGGQEMPQEPQGFMPQEEAAPMQQEMAAPMPQGFAVGGGVQQQQQGLITISEGTLQAALASKPPSAPKPKRQKVAAVAQPRGRQNVARPNFPQQQPNQSLTGITPSAGGFMQPGGVGSKKKYDVGGNVALEDNDPRLADEETFEFIEEQTSLIPQDKPPLIYTPEEEEFNPQANVVTEKRLDKEAILRSLLEIISKGEGTNRPSGYNIIYGYDEYKTDDMKNELKKTPLSKMTLEQVQEFQKKLIAQTKGTLSPPISKKRGSGAVGKYQINHKNIKTWLKRKRFNKNTIFSPEVQDEMAVELLKENKLDDLINLKITPKEFHNRVADIWHSFEKYNTPDKKKKIKSDELQELIYNNIRKLKKMEGGFVSA